MYLRPAFPDTSKSSLFVAPYNSPYTDVFSVSDLPPPRYPAISTSPNSSAVSVCCVVGPTDAYQLIPFGVVPS